MGAYDILSGRYRQKSTHRTAGPADSRSVKASERGGLWGVAAAVVAVLLAYVWIVTAGTWTRWPTYTAYHQKQADAFRSGQLHLHDVPDPRLMALDDPYDPVANKPYRLHDASLYNGRYYLYWGPVPALMLAGVNTIPGVRHVPDQVLVFACSAGALGFAALLLLHVRRRHFPDAPAWSVPLGVLTIGLATPAPFILGRASVYEVAVVSSLMFLLAGLYCALRAAETIGARSRGEHVHRGAGAARARWDAARARRAWRSWSPHG